MINPFSNIPRSMLENDDFKIPKKSLKNKKNYDFITIYDKDGKFITTKDTMADCARYVIDGKYSDKLYKNILSSISLYIDKKLIFNHIFIKVNNKNKSIPQNIDPRPYVEYGKRKELRFPNDNKYLVKYNLNGELVDIYRSPVGIDNLTPSNMHQIYKIANTTNHSYRGYMWFLYVSKSDIKDKVRKYQKTQKDNSSLFLW